MENASKALIMAGSILLAIMVIGLLLFSWGKLSDFKKNDDKFEEVDNISKFNLQFANYENRIVYGYEIISLANKIADYNMRYSNAKGAKNDEKYKKISMTINLDHKNNAFAKETSNLLFTIQTYTIEGIQSLILREQGIERFYGSSNAASKIAKSIDSLILSPEQITYNENYRHMSPIQSKLNALETFNRLTDGEKIEEYKNNPGKVEDNYKEMNDILKGRADIMEYYEFYQFKRGKFKCNGITYDDNSTGRISSISFIFSGDME